MAQALTLADLLYQAMHSYPTILSRQASKDAAQSDLGVSRLVQARAELDTQRWQEETALTPINKLVGAPVMRCELMAKIGKYAVLHKRADGVFRAQTISVTVQRNKSEVEEAEHEVKEMRAQALPQLSIQTRRQIGNAYYPGAQGFNSVGLSAKVKHDAYDYSIFGSMKGSVSYASVDSLSDETKTDPMTYYRMKVNILESKDKAAGISRCGQV